MTILRFDLETFSEVPIKSGTFKYAEAAEILLFAYALDDDPVEVWDLTSQALMPPDLKTHLSNPDLLVQAHNLSFDRTLLRDTIGIDLPIERCRCTMARALSHGLPGSLDTLSEIFNLPIDKAKSKEGYKLIRKFCMPKKYVNRMGMKKEDFSSEKVFWQAVEDDRQQWKLDGKDRHTRGTDPEDWQRFIEYAKLDIEAMRVLDRKLPRWNYSGSELELWQLDQKINDNGICVDIDLANAAIRAVDRAQEKLKARTGDLTFGVVESTTQRDALLEHILAVYGVQLPDLTMSTVERRMDDPDLPSELKELLAIRLQASSTSTAKYAKLIKGASSDGRLRGTLQFCGASRTGRWGGRLFQPQNLPKPNLKDDDINFGIECLKADSEDLFYTDVMELTRNTIRGCIVAAPGKKLVISDLASIEGRVLPWLAGEQSELDAYAAFDAGKSFDMYILTYARAFRIDPKDVTKAQRQIGKVMVLMLGFQGSVGAFITGAATYGIDLAKMAAGLIDDLPDYAMKKAEGSWDWAVKNKRTLGLEKEVYLVCRALTEMWRVSHPKTVQFWYNLEDEVIRAINGPTCTAELKPGARRDGNWLRIVLPSGRSLCYPSPRVQQDDEGNTSISYMGTDQYTRKWQRIKTFSGKLAENVTQAVARDVMAANMPRIEKAGYPMVLSVHDEIITEVPDTSEFTVGELSALLATVPPWATGLPLAASGFECYRYRKGD